MKSKIKQEKGITLIALVVTIIVLLILAGISINALAGQNGLLNRAVKSKEATGIAQTEEAIKVAVMDAATQGLGTITDANLKTALNNNVGAGKYEITGDETNGWTVTVDGKDYKISSTGNMEGTTSGGSSGGNQGGNTGGSGNLPESAEGQLADTAVKNPESYGSNPNAQATADGAGKIFAKPEGATYVTGTVDTGVVVNIKGSEFVWVPVDDVVLDTSKEAKLPKSESAGTSSGKKYTPMAIKVENNYKGILYKFSGSNGYLYYPNNANYQGSSTQYREPDVSGYDGGSSDTVDGKITIEKLAVEYNAMIESVLKYKGFYVARYEAGLDANKNIVFKDAHITENNVTTTDASNTETNTWYGLYKKIKTFTTESDKVVSSMIWGSQYDAMMNWMAKNNKTVGSSDSSKRNSGTVTGSEPKDVINNVYDLYGCHYEWTLEANGTSSRVIRGGFSGISSAPSSRGYNDPGGMYSGNSSRATLYIKCNV